MAYNPYSVTKFQNSVANPSVLSPYEKARQARDAAIKKASSINSSDRAESQAYKNQLALNKSKPAVPTGNRTADYSEMQNYYAGQSKALATAKQSQKNPIGQYSDGGTRNAGTGTPSIYNLQNPIQKAMAMGRIPNEVPGGLPGANGGLPTSGLPTGNTPTDGGGGGGGGGGSGVNPGLSASTPEAAATVAAPGYNGLSDDEYRQSLLAAVRGGIMSDYEANANVIKNNLARALSDLGAEQAALQPLYQDRMNTIAADQFATAEGTKELMNQGGWNASNSGLAVGEQSRIKIGADKNRSAAMQDKTLAEQDINRRTSLTQEESANTLTSLEKEKNAKLSGAEADALIKSDERNRDIYMDDRNFNESKRQFEADYNMEQKKFSESVRQFNTQISEQRKARSASAKAAAARLEAESSKGEKEDWYNVGLSGLYSQPTQAAAAQYLRSIVSDENIPDSIKTKLIKDAEQYISSINEDGTVYNPNKEKTTPSYLY